MPSFFKRKYILACLSPGRDINLILYFLEPYLMLYDIAAQLTSLSASEVKCLGSLPGLRIVPLDDAAVADWRAQWEPLPKQRTHYDWGALHTELTLPSLDSDQPIGWAFYVGKKLCGLVTGTLFRSSPTSGGIELDIAEGSPDPSHPLKKKVIPCMLEVAEALVRNNRLEYIHLKIPNASAKRQYIERGYEFPFGTNTHGVKRITLT
jgi:hypothetical protein